MVVASKFHRNAIITGSIDAFCLVCESYLKSEEDASAHIEKPVHKKNLDAVLYLEKYEDDHIWKIKKGYFCEFCNQLLATTTRVKLHVTELGHKDNRGVKQLKRVGNTVIAFKSLVIKECSWHGLIENTCIICNIEYENEDIHKNGREHILNLVQNKVQFDGDNNIFRKIDDTSFHCVTCNTVLAADGIATHFNSADHKTIYAECCESNAVEAEITNNSAENAKASNAFAEKAKDTNISAENYKVTSDDFAENGKATNDSAEKLKVTSNSAENAKVPNDSAEKLNVTNDTTENAKATNDSAEKFKVTSDTTENAKATSDPAEKLNVPSNSAENAKATNDSAEKLKVTSDTTENAKATSDSAEKLNVTSDSTENAKISSNSSEKFKVTNDAFEIAEVKKANVANDCAENAKETKNSTEKQQGNTGPVEKQEQNEKSSGTVQLAVTITEYNPEKHAANAQKKVPTPLELNAYYCKALAAKDYVAYEENGKRFCILCGWNLKSNLEVSKHIKSDHHKIILRMHKERLEKMSKETHQGNAQHNKCAPKEINITEVKIVKEADTNKSKLLESIQEFQTNRVKVDLITESAFCNMCLNNVEFDYNTIVKHIEGHKKIPKKQGKKAQQVIDNNGIQIESTSLYSKPVHINRNRKERSLTRSSSSSSQMSKDEDEDEFAKHNNITLNRFTNNAVCTVCETHLSLSLESMKQHIAGTKHNSNSMKLKNVTKQQYTKEPFIKSVKCYTQVDSMLSCDMVVDYKICITRNSFLMIQEYAGRVYCFGCKIFITDVLEHKASIQHRRIFDNSYLVTSLEKEFVRVIGNVQQLHCGHCNLVVENDEELEEHLQTVEHIEFKRANLWRLQLHLPVIKKEREAGTIKNVKSS